MMEPQSQGTSALKAQATETPPPDNIITMDQIRAMFHDEISKAVKPMQDDISGIKRRLDAMEAETQRHALREETLTPAQVDNRISDSENRMVVKFENIATGFQSTVKELQRFWEAHTQESREYRAEAQERMESMKREFNEKFLQLREDQLKQLTKWGESADNMRTEIQIIAAQVQTNEANTNVNRTMISDIDARGQKLSESYADLKQDVKTLSADVKAGQAHIENVIDKKFASVEEDQEEISTFITEHKTRTRLLNGIGGIIMTLLGLLTTAQAEQIRNAIFGG